jgi:DNA-binding transcriptional LysR family regulator
MKHGIELRHLTYFTTLADELHFGRAAERLGIAQAPLSQQIKQLEQRLGTRLFNRTTRKVQLTPAGETFLTHAQELLGGLDRAVNHTRALAGEEAGHLVIGAVHIALSHFLPPIIAEFRKLWPAVTVEVVPLGTAELLRTLENGSINIAFIRPTEQSGYMQMERLASEGFLAALPVGHPLAARSDLVLADFAGEDMIGYAPILGASYSGVVVNALRRAGVHPRSVQACNHTLAVTTLVASGLGVAIVPSWVRHIASPWITYRPLAGLPESIELAVAWPTGDSPAIVQDFIATTRRVSARLVAGGIMRPEVRFPMPPPVTAAAHPDPAAPSTASPPAARPRTRRAGSATDAR